MVATAVAIDDRPSALRYPRGDGVGVDMPEFGVPLEIGKGRIIKEGSSVALLSYGTRLQECLLAAETLGTHGLTTTVADARFAKPLDTDGAAAGARARGPDHRGGGRHWRLRLLRDADPGRTRRSGKRHQSPLHGAPDVFIDQDSPAAMYAQAGLDAKGIVAKVFEASGRMSGAMPFIRVSVAGAPEGCPGRAVAYVCRESGACGPYLAGWNAMKVILAQPRGFCAGVVRAIEIVERALQKYGPPVYVRHEIVHNKHVVESLKAKGAVFVEDVSEVPDNAVTIFSAHGVAKSVRG